MDDFPFPSRGSLRSDGSTEPDVEKAVSAGRSGGDSAASTSGAAGKSGAAGTSRAAGTSGPRRSKSGKAKSGRSKGGKGWLASMSKPKRTLVITLIVMTALAVGLAAAAAWFVWQATSTFDRGTATIEAAFPDEQTRPAADDNSETILLIGSDTRGEVDEGVMTGPADSRSDTIMVARIPEDRESIVIVSIMRDSWVDIPGYGDNKVNAALAYGGVPLTVQTLEDLLDTRIDHVAVIDFNGFKGLTDSLGGVTVTNQNTFSSGGHDFQKGQITLQGEEALAFVRARKNFGDGDYQRVRNQQAYLKGAASKLLSKETMTNPGTVLDVIGEVSPFLTVSEDLKGSYVVSLAPSLRGLRAADLYFVTAPTEGPGTSADGQSIIVLDPQGMDELRQAFKDDTLLEYAQSH